MASIRCAFLRAYYPIANTARNRSVMMDTPSQASSDGIRAKTSTIFSVMFKPLVAALVVALPIAAQIPFSTFLKSNVTVKQIATDSQGFIYVYGDVNPAPGPNYSLEIFAGRVDPQTGAFTWLKYFGGAALTEAVALAVDPAGSAYITGYTTASQLLPAPGAPGGSTAASQRAFAAKIDAAGTVAYSTLFSGGIRAFPKSIAVDSQGQAIISGRADAGYPVTPGAYNNAWTEQSPFTTKLDATGTRLVFSAVGVGGSSLVLDDSGNIFIGGSTDALIGQTPPAYPTTPGAFQTSFQPYFTCGGAPPCFYQASVGEQYVTKLSADGSKLIYSTYITGSKGADNAGLAVDASGNAWVTGTSNSPDYPYTTTAVAANTGTFLSELDPTGSKLVLSAPVGVPPGTGNNLTIDAQQNLIVTGVSSQPPSDHRPSQCTANSPGGIYVMRISRNDGSVLDTRIVPSVPPGTATSSAMDAAGNLYVAGTTILPTIPLTQGIAFDSDVTSRTDPGAYLVRINFAAPVEPIGCVTDATSMTLIGPVAPGQLITLYGSNIRSDVSITFDGQAAPLLYQSATQVNAQVPFEIDGKSSTVMQVSAGGTLLQSRLFAVVPENPSVFVREVESNAPCGNTTVTGFIAFALNEDGSINSCDNPAARGANVSLFVNGIGDFTRNRNTGAIVSKPDYLLSTAAAFSGSYSLEVESLADQAGAISGIGQIVVRVPDNAPATMNVTLNLNGIVAGPFNPATANAATFGATPVIVFVKP